MIKSLNSNSRINLQVLEKIERNRRDNRDDIKRLIKEGKFYKIEIDVPLMKDIDLKVISRLMGEGKEGFSVVKKACNSVKAILRVGDKEIEDFKYELYLTYKGKVFQSCTMDMDNVILNLRCTLDRLDLRSKTTIYIEDIMDIDKSRYKVMEIEPRKHKCYVKYTQFDNLRNYPNLKIKNEVDVLRQIIPDYHYTGYTWKVEHKIYEDFRNKEVRYDMDKYEIDVNGNVWKDEGEVFGIEYERIRMKYPDKYSRWKFAMAE